MNVPNLWLTAGVQYAATSPLAYTLQIANKYCHGGHRKENKYLYTLDKVQPIQRRWTYYKRTQKLANKQSYIGENDWHTSDISFIGKVASYVNLKDVWTAPNTIGKYMQYYYDCLLYTSPSPRDRTRSRMPSSA